MKELSPEPKIAFRKGEKTADEDVAEAAKAEEEEEEKKEEEGEEKAASTEKPLKGEPASDAVVSVPVYGGYFFTCR